MSKEIEFYERNEIDNKTKFFRYMDSLVSHKTFSRIEAILMVTIYYSQLISGFFSVQVGILKNDILPDKYLMLLQKIIRIRDLFENSYNAYSFILLILFSVLVLITIVFIYRMKKTGKVIFYSVSEVTINFFLKLFFYVLYQPTLDFCLSLICFGEDNPNFSKEQNIKCDLSDKIHLLIIMLLSFFYTIFLEIFLSLFYNESFMLSNSVMSRVTTKYELYMNVNCVFFSIILTFTYNLGGLIFILYNIILSFVFLKIFLDEHPYYDPLINFLIGYFHLLYVWASLFCLIFYFIPVTQVSIVFLFIALTLFWMQYNMTDTMYQKLTLDTPFHKLKTKYDILLYIKYLITKLNTIETNPEDKAEIVGIIHLHKVECPLIECPSKVNKKKFYLPITDEWSKPNQKEINDRVYLFNFITFVFDFYISQKYYMSDIQLNYSMYYLQTIGNFCGAMYYYQKAGEENLSLEEQFMLFRTGELISKALVKMTKPSDEIASTLEEINTSMYFKYQDLSEKFFLEISSDINLSTDFWELFITKDCKRKKLDFNKIFSLTDKIRVTKQKIDDIWKELFETYNGCNEIFDLYELYVEYINDDNITLRELMKVRNKNFAMEGILNYYNTLFNIDTGIIVCSGDRGKEGMIEKVSENLSSIFLYKEEELKGMNIGILMPRMFEKDHKRFMQRNINIGEKRIIDKTFRTYAKDKKNALIVIDLSVKLFPILSESMFFCAMITKENLDDVILLDQDYNIQGMSDKLYNLFRLNSGIFQDCDVPFWMICKEFIQHYQIFMANNPLVKTSYSRNKDKNNNNNDITYNKNQKITNDDISQISSRTNNTNNLNFNENDENEGAELDFEINENADVQWELTVPPIFKLYIAEENKQKNFISMTMGIQREDSEKLSSDIITENSHEDDENFYDENGKMLNGNFESSTGSKSLNQSYGGQDHDQEFQNAIGRYRSFFTSNNNNNYAELMNLLDKLNEGNDQVFKFIISFSQIKYGEGKIGYQIRCIDNKDNIEASTNDNNDNNSKSDDKDKMMKFNIDNKEKDDDNNNKQKLFDRRKYLQGIKDFEEETVDDLNKMKSNLENFNVLVNEDEQFKDDVDSFHQEILLYSRVLGANSTTVMDENGSQNSSSSAYTNSITKKTRVQEIKSNIMRNVSSFYTIILIKFLFILFMLVTLIFNGIYMIKFDKFTSITTTIDSIHSNINYITFLYIEGVSVLTSLKAICDIINEHGDITFNPYTFNDYNIPNNTNKQNAYEDYVNNQKQFMSFFYNTVIDYKSQLELVYSEFINDQYNQETLFKVISDSVSSLSNDKIGFMIAISQQISSINKLLNTSEYNFPFEYKNKDNEIYVKDLETITITKNYQTIFPELLDFSYNSTEICSKENKSKIKMLDIILIVYIIFTLIFAGFYALFLYLTNKNMEDGLIKMSKIDPLLIQDTIKTIRIFNKSILSKFRGRTEKALNRKDGVDTSEMTNFEKEKEEEKEENEETIGYYDPSLHKKLTILSYSYFHSIILLILFGAFVIPIHIETRQFIKNENKLFEAKKFLFDDFIQSSLDILNLKMELTNCGITNYLNYRNFAREKYKGEIINQIKKYTKFTQFYQEKYFLSLCPILYELDSTDYKNCKEDTFIGEFCSVETLLQLTKDMIYTLNSFYNIKKNQLSNYDPYIEFQSESFKKLEYFQKNYFRKIPIKFIDIFNKSEIEYSDKMKKLITTIIIFMVICLWGFCLYIMIFYIQKLVHILLISRCIFKIIPTKVINQTKELEDWIDDKY